MSVRTILSVSSVIVAISTAAQSAGAQQVNDTVNVAAPRQRGQISDAWRTGLAALG